MRALALLAFGVALLLAPALAAPAPRAPLPDAGPVVVAAPGGWLLGYANPVAAVPVGGSLLFVNGDLMTHNVEAYQVYGSDAQPWCAIYERGRCPLFWSAIVPFGETSEVVGLDELQPLNSYAFYCRTHAGMKGTLVALPGVG